MKEKLLFVCCIALFSMVSGTLAAEIVIHGDPYPVTNPYTGGSTKDKAECMYIIEAEDGNIVGSFGQFGEKGDGNCHLWLHSGSSVTVTCSESTDVIYVQSMGSDGDDGYADYYVDDVLVASIQTYMRGIWYLEIKDIATQAHTVKVVARGGVVNLDYFGFGDATIFVDIDIKPDSYPNPINLGSHGLTPVAIFSKVGFDATSVDPNTVNLAGASVATRGKKGDKFMAHENDVDGDGMVDLVVQVVTGDINPALLQQDGDVIYAVLTGNTSGGEAIEGKDEIIIVPPKE